MNALISKNKFLKLAAALIKRWENCLITLKKSPSKRFRSLILRLTTDLVLEHKLLLLIKVYILIVNILLHNISQKYITSSSGLCFRLCFIKKDFVFRLCLL